MMKLRAFRDKIPSKENISIESVIVSLSIEVNVTKDISFPNTLFPRLQKNELIKLVEFIRNLQIDRE